MASDRADSPHYVDISRPTSVRYLVVGLATAMAVLLYLDRFCLSYLATYMSEEFSLDDQQEGMLLGVFFLSYALFQVPSGWLTDRFGARLMLTLYIVIWSLFTGFMGIAAGFLGLLLLRFGCGLAQAGAYPTGASMISKWVPFAGRGQASGIVSSGGRLGGVLAPLLTAYVLVAFVPVSISSQFTEADLLNMNSLTQALKQTGDSPTDQMAKVVRDLEPESYAQVQAASPEAQPSALLHLLNDVMARRELYERVDVEQFNLPSQALFPDNILPAELSMEHLTRCNRLLLEEAFPTGLRKIYVHGWRPVIVVYGLAGLFVAAGFWIGVRDRPRVHPACNASEVNLIEQDQPAVTRPHGKVSAIPLRYLLRSRSLWLSSVSQFGTNFGWSFLMLLLPKLLAEVYRVPPIARGWLACAPIAVGMLGMLLGGWLTDRLTRALGVRWGRGIPMASTRFLAMAAYLACLLLDSPVLVVIAFCVVAVATDLGTASVWAFKQDVGGRYVGSILGWGNMWGNFGSFAAMIVLPAFAGESRWEYRFLACAIAFFIAGIAALGVDARIPIAPPDEQ